MKTLLVKFSYQLDEIRRFVSDLLTAHGSVLRAVVIGPGMAAMTERPALAQPFYSKRVNGGKKFGELSLLCNLRVLCSARSPDLAF